MSEMKTSIGKRRNPGQSGSPMRNYTIPDGASIPSEFIPNPSPELMSQSFFVNNLNTGKSEQFVPGMPGELPPGFPGGPPQQQSSFIAPPAMMNPQITYQQQVEQFQQQRIQQRMDDITRKLDLLLKSTVLTKDIEITNELIFTISNLTTEQQSTALMASVAVKYRIEESLILREYLLAQSITKVSGMKIQDIFGDDSLESRLFFVKKLDEKVATRLHQEVLIFQEECEKQYGVRTQADFDKLINEIKKA